MSAERPPDPAPADMFGEKPAAAPRIPLRDKVHELKRELEYRRNAYPKLIEQGRLSEEGAARQLAALESVLADMNVQPWPQTRNLVAHWRPKAETLTVLGVHASKMHRDELIAVLAFTVDVMRKAGLLEKEKPK
jgi:hypothetical protein